MRRIKIEQWCDYCWADGETLTESTHTWTIGAVESETRPALKVVEACDVHAKNIQDLVDILAGAAAYHSDGKAAPTHEPALFQGGETHLSPSQEPSPCPECGRTLSMKSSLVGHIWSQHAQYERPASPTKCPDCGFKNHAAQVGQHRRSAHGFDALQEALDACR